MNAVVVLTCVLLYLIAGQPDWLICGPLALRMMVYHFYHANIIHLAVNSTAAMTMFAPRHRDNISCLLAGYIIASLVYPLSAQPCIGLSNILYAVIGLRTPQLRNVWWRTAPVITFLAVTFVMLFIQGVSGLTHIVSLAAGVVISCMRRLWKS